jgi:hypothetical protein
VKKNKTYTALVFLLSLSLLFNQIGLNFFHDKHDAHKSYKVQSEQTQLHYHNDHCKACALDTLFHLYFDSSPEFQFYQPVKTVVAIPVLAKVIATNDFTKGRAPPFFI